MAGVQQMTPAGKSRGSRDPDLPRAKLRDATEGLQGEREAWTWLECERAILEIKVAAAQLAVDLVRARHNFGRYPAQLVEEVVERFPECARQQCGLKELPEWVGVRARHLYRCVELAVRQLGQMQRALEVAAGAKQRDISDEWLIKVAQRKKGHKEKGKKRKDILKPPGEGDLSSVLVRPVGGPLKGLDVRVRRPKNEFDEGVASWRLDPKKGLVTDEKAKHCRSWEEWDEGFTWLMCVAPAEARDLLAGFQKWIRVMSGENAWESLRKFYDHLVSRIAKDISVTFELTSYMTLWELGTPAVYLVHGGRGAGLRKPWTGTTEAPKPDNAAEGGAGARATKAGAGKGGKNPGDATTLGEPESGGGAQRAPGVAGCGEGETAISSSREPELKEEAPGSAESSGMRWWAQLENLQYGECGINMGSLAGRGRVRSRKRAQEQQGGLTACREIELEEVACI
ncbi:hypothetical protein CYMTET_51416 [Cymbomonas tetramitiformis]|uniref:Uncharacterized protein n=1 Tax=Cymbomonas tetramitiformis TaxID=36881 RepID=A0AAE0BL42_9CHLO|nr:hypothetical protein CYMTET_51416 [Cymbomonas tetramitiformis]